MVRRSSNMLHMVVLEQPAIEAVELAAVLHALSDPARLETARGRAGGGERQGGSFALGLTRPPRPHHFKVRREAGLPYPRLEGTARHVTLRRDELDAKFPGLLDAV